MKHNSKDIESILQCSYYDHLTDYAWNYIIGGDKHFNRNVFPINDLGDFIAMKNMLENRKLSVDQFIYELKGKSSEKIIRYSFNPKKRTIKVRTRSFWFQYDENKKSYNYIAFARIAKSIRLINREYHKCYRSNGLFPIEYLLELDKELYSRFHENEKVRKWKKTDQFNIDIEYCRSMIPYIMGIHESKTRFLGHSRRLNIILRDKDRVSIGILMYYSPEEMMAIPTYPRSEWKKGIEEAFESLERIYNTELEEHKIITEEWCSGLSDIISGKSTFDIENSDLKISASKPYSKIVLNAAMGRPQEVLTIEDYTQMLDSVFCNSRDKYKIEINSNDYHVYSTYSLLVDENKQYVTFTFNEEVVNALHYKKVNTIRIPKVKSKFSSRMLNMLDLGIQDEITKYIKISTRILNQTHKLLIEEIRYIIEKTAPLLFYSGACEKIRKNYNISFEIEDNDEIWIKALFTDRASQVTLSPENYKSNFRVWWAQELLKEFKHAKECALNPESCFDFDLPF